MLCIEKIQFSFSLNCVHAKFGCKHFTYFIVIFMDSYTLTYTCTCILLITNIINYKEPRLKGRRASIEKFEVGIQKISGISQ